MTHAEKLNARAETEAEQGLLTLVPELNKDTRRPIVRRPVDDRQWALARLS